MVSRRSVMFGLGASALINPRARADMWCNEPVPIPIDPFGHFIVGQRCQVGLSYVNPVARQRKSQWCWAASISGIFSQHGFKVSQEIIVDEIYGGDVNLPAWGPTIASATSRSWVTDGESVSRSFDADCQVLLDSQFGVRDLYTANVVGEELASGNPLIIGCVGHAMVLTAITFDQFNNGTYNIVEAIVRDPWPGNPSKRMLTAQEWWGTQFLAKVEVTEN